MLTVAQAGEAGQVGNSNAVFVNPASGNGTYVNPNYPGDVAATGPRGTQELLSHMLALSTNNGHADRNSNPPKTNGAGAETRTRMSVSSGDFKSPAPAVFVLALRNPKRARESKPADGQWVSFCGERREMSVEPALSVSGRLRGESWRSLLNETAAR